MVIQLFFLINKDCSESYNCSYNNVLSLSNFLLRLFYNRGEGVISVSVIKHIEEKRRKKKKEKKEKRIDLVCHVLPC